MAYCVNCGVELDKSNRPLNFNTVTGKIEGTNIYIVGDANAYMPLLHVSSNEGFLSGKEDMGFEELLARGKVELNLVDGLILPNLRMNENDACSFLNDEGRCTIHAVRPAICRLFPLGRVYGDEGFSYFLQKGECAKENRVKIKVKKWIDTPNLQKNEEYVLAWHTFIRMVGDLMIELKKKGTSELMNEIAMYVLNTFYVKTILFSEAYANTGKDLDVLAYEKLIAMIDEASAKIKGWIH